MTSALDAKILAARAVGELARRAGRGGGTSLPGKVLTRLEPRAIDRLAGRLRDGTAVISATNGKTTTAAMAASVLQRSGVALVHNRAGANMAGGVASTLLGAARRGDGIDGDLGLFEIDEFWLDRISPQLRPRAMVLGNLFRDQLDRFGELETIADRWAALVRTLGQTALALNADDPLIADLGRDRAGVTYYGIEDPSMASARCSTHRTQSTAAGAAPPTSTRRSISATSGATAVPRVASSGRNRRSRPSASSSTAPATPASSSGHAAGSATVSLPLPGLYNVYNALGAATLCLELGVGLDQVVAGLEAVSAAFGRAEHLRVSGVELSILLVKNPAGANEILRTLVLEPGEHELLGILNDRTADGRDVSWIWDADFELLAQRVRRVTCAGTRAAELALRLKYAGVAGRLVSTSSRSWRRRSTRRLRSASGGHLYAPADLHGAARAARGARATRGRGSVLGGGPGSPAVSVIWHDLECGAYARGSAGLARARGALRRSGARRRSRDRPRHDRLGSSQDTRVTALDIDEQLLRELAERARGLDVTTVVADARSFDLGRRFALCIVPMQTIQLLGGVEGRTVAFLRCAPGICSTAGSLAIAIADQLDLFEVTPGGPAPLPDMCEIDGDRATRAADRGPRRRRAVRARTRAPDRDRSRRQLSAETDRIHLDRLDPRRSSR